MLNLLDYGKSDPFTGIIGKVCHLAWPVNAYRVTFPRILNGSNALNAFERVILELLNAVGELDAHELAVETCIPPDLVKGILLRLQDKGFIDEYNAVIMEKYNDSVKYEKDNLSFVTALFSVNALPENTAFPAPVGCRESLAEKGRGARKISNDPSKCYSQSKHAYTTRCYQYIADHEETRRNF
nr:hypothetical protein [Acetobacter persici]